MDQHRALGCAGFGEYAFLGVRATVLADVGDGTVVGAGAVVVKALAPGITAVGVPAR